MTQHPLTVDAQGDLTSTLVGRSGDQEVKAILGHRGKPAVVVTRDVDGRLEVGLRRVVGEPHEVLFTCDLDTVIHVVDLDAVAAAVVAAGFPAYVEQTGGGCATIYAGDQVTVPDGPGREIAVYPVLAGPGWFTGPGWTGARASLYDLFIGPDQGYGPNDETIVYEATLADTVETLAQRVVDQLVAAGQAPTSPDRPQEGP